MSDNTRHCYVCLAKVEAIANPSGWLHCPRCGANIGFDPPAAPETFRFPSPLVVEEPVLATVSPYVYEKPIGYLFGGPEDPIQPTLHHKPKAPHQFKSYDEYVAACGMPSYVAADPQQAVAWDQPPVCHTTNPKTLMGRQKLSILSVVPPASIICEAEAMHYGAFEAPRKDGKKGYGPYNWRDDPVEMMIYVDACLRHIFAIVDGEEFDPDSGKPHLGHAKACLGIIADAKENGTLIDDRPKVRNRVASSMLACWKKLQSLTGEPT
jgi:hypothetical protein